MARIVLARTARPQKLELSLCCCNVVKEGTCSFETSRYKTVSRNVVLVESVSTPYDIISGAISGVQIWKGMDNLLFVSEDSCSLYGYSMSRH